MSRKKFTETTLTKHLEQCAECFRLIERGEKVWMAGDTFVCDEGCAALYNRPMSRNDRRLEYLAMKFN